MTAAETDFLDGPSRARLPARGFSTCRAGTAGSSIELARARVRGHRRRHLLRAPRGAHRAGGRRAESRDGLLAQSDMRELPGERAVRRGVLRGRRASASSATRATPLPRGGGARASRPAARFVLDASKVAESLLPAFRERHEIENDGVRFEAENRYDPERGRIENRYTITRRRSERRPKLASHRLYTVSQLLGDAARRGPRADVAPRIAGRSALPARLAAALRRGPEAVAGPAGGIRRRERRYLSECGSRRAAEMPRRAARVNGASCVMTTGNFPTRSAPPERPADGAPGIFWAAACRRGCPRGDGRRGGGRPPSDDGRQEEEDPPLKVVLRDAAELVSARRGRLALGLWPPPRQPASPDSSCPGLPRYLLDEVVGKGRRRAPSRCSSPPPRPRRSSRASRPSRSRRSSARRRSGRSRRCGAASRATSAGSPSTTSTRRRSGSLLSRVMTDAEGIRNLVGTGPRRGRRRPRHRRAGARDPLPPERQADVASRSPSCRSSDSCCSTPSRRCARSSASGRRSTPRSRAG